MMNAAVKIGCRTFQLAFRLSIPLLPYREPECFDHIQALPPLLERLGIHTVLLVTDSTLRQAGITAPLEELLEKAGIRCAVFDGTRANPTVHNVEDAWALYQAEGCQGLIAFGGGSSMDCAKAAGARIVKPRQSVSQMKGLLKIHKKLPLLIAVPTTAGTGSETTLAAVITDSKKRHKYPINDFSLIPHYAVLDYHETLGLPADLTATTGMDALTHAVEAYIGRSTTRETRKMAETAVCLIARYLKAAYENGQDKRARRGMLRASYYAGAAFTKSYVGYVHAVAHSLGGQYKIPHGLANAVTLPVVLRLYGPACEKRLARLARKTGIADDHVEDRTAARDLIGWIQGLNDQMGIPRHFPQIRAKDIPTMARHADREGNPLYPVPMLLDRKGLEQIYHQLKGE